MLMHDSMTIWFYSSYSGNRGMEWSDQTNPRPQGRYGVDFTEDHT